MPADLAVDAEVDLVTDAGAYFLQARLNVSLPGVAHDIAWTLLETAHQTCPYSKLSKSNMKVEINLI
ncbi:disulfide bond formation regulator [Massilia niastensis]|uniref:disulfide bond formation regulator n=1 Tax=Massilia niastensis TaxID=544911 RepID=UPI00039C874E|nr:disulfide bond formation regulator [Massilia niastensis]